MDSLAHRIRRSVAQRGIWQTVRLCAVSLEWMIRPSLRRAEARLRQIDSEFDGRYGVDTGGDFRPKPDEVTGSNWLLGGNYRPVEPEAFHQAMRELPIRHEEFLFLDFGSGKGRTLLLAAEYPFKKIIGVEYCGRLNEVARRNVERFQAAVPRCPDIDAIEGDASEYPIPDDPFLLFLNNPFAGPVMARVAENVVASFRRHPRRIVIIYFWPVQARLWDETRCFSRLRESPAIYDTGRVLQNAPCATTSTPATCNAPFIS